MTRLLQSRAAWTVGLVTVALIAVVWPLTWWLHDPTPGPAHPTVWATGYAAVMGWWVGASLMLQLTWLEWLFGVVTVRRYAAQVSWALGWLLLAVHVAVAFGVAHGWSHTEAVRHTARTSGVGAGVWVNYFVLAVWGVDVVWLVWFPLRYAFRPAWVGWLIHGFLAFVAFNAAVVYAGGSRRWFMLPLFVWLGRDLIAWWRRRADWQAAELLRQAPGERPA